MVLICLLRQLNVKWHKIPRGSVPVSFKQRLTACTFSASSVQRASSELHVENEPIYSNLNFSEVLFAFFCVIFIVNIHYPKDRESVAILLQCKVAGINAEGN
jgi:hypothetical protein